jgi:ketosteroid isomerase-like protein
MGRRADVVERLYAFGPDRLGESLAFLHPDAEYLPDPAKAPVRGHAAIRAYVAREIRRLGTLLPEPIPLTLTEVGEQVLVQGQLRVPQTTGDVSFVGFEPIAWLYEFAGDRVSRVTVYWDWEQARRAAGIARAAPPTRRFAKGWAFAVARRAWPAWRRAAPRPAT